MGVLLKLTTIGVSKVHLLLVASEFEELQVVESYSAINLSVLKSNLL